MSCDIKQKTGLKAKIQDVKNSKKQENKKHIRISIKESEKTVLNK